MSPRTAQAAGGDPGTAGTEPQPAIESLRQALSQIFAAERRLRARGHALSGELSYVQVRSLAALGRAQEMTAGELARSADLNPATVTGMLDHLEEAGLVERRRSTSDRRVCNVSLTESGRELLEHKVARWQAHWEAELAEFSEAEIAVAARVLQQIAGIFDAASKPPSES